MTYPSSPIFVVHVGTYQTYSGFNSGVSSPDVTFFSKILAQDLLHAPQLYVQNFHQFGFRALSLLTQRTSKTSRKTKRTTTRVDAIDMSEVKLVMVET
jgi:hypothetical protein